jgi:hypothetical protein
MHGGGLGCSLSKAEPEFTVPLNARLALLKKPAQSLNPNNAGGQTKLGRLMHGVPFSLQFAPACIHHARDGDSFPETR